MSLEMLSKLFDLSSGEPVTHLFQEPVVDIKGPPDPKPHKLPEGAPPRPAITVDHDAGTITFKIQDGPINQVGKNGCQVDDMIEVALEFITTANERFHCDENDHAIAKLQEALFWLEKRKRNRTKRGVEGYNEV